MLDLDELAAELGVEPESPVLLARAARDETESRELTYVRKDGTRLRVAQRLTVERDADGHPIGYLGVGSDITEQVRAQAALREARDFNDAVLDTAGSLVIVTDRDAADRALQSRRRADHRLRRGRHDRPLADRVADATRVARRGGGRSSPPRAPRRSRATTSTS